MKKVFTLILAMTIVFAGFAQVKQSIKSDNAKKSMATAKSVARDVESFESVQIEPNMLRTDGELDYSIYDWQSNQGPRTWTVAWPDGKINFASTWSGSVSPFNDRGTVIGTYDYENDEWIPGGGRVENEKTGFGSICRYGENGLVVAAHTSTNLGIYIIEDKDNIVPNSVPASLYTNNTSYTHPAVMTSGANRDIIHVFAGNFDDSSIPFKYWRSSDGGQNWDKAEVILPYIEEFGSDWGTNEYYWMETTDDNCLALVINSAWCDGMVIYSYDDGETWERKVFWHHPGVNTTFDNWFMYPRWTSAQWANNGELRMVYEFNGRTGEPGSGSYYPAIGGVAYWASELPYAGTDEVTSWGYDPTNEMPPVPGQPFIMDSAYIFEDNYAAWPRWSDQTYDNPYYFGYVTPIDENGNPESWEEAQEFNIEDFSLHGSYNSGCSAMPTLCKVPGNDDALVAVWSAMDENNLEESTGNFYYKLFASYSEDGGRTWYPQIQLTNDFMFQYTEFVYLQAAVVHNRLVIAAMADVIPGTYVQDDDNDPEDNLYQGLTFELDEIFDDDAVQEVSHDTHMTLFPNPAVDQLNVTLNQSAGIVIYNIMGQAVMNLEGHLGANSINISELNAGVYFISAGNDTQKFVVK